MVGRFPEKRDSSPNETSGMCNDFVETAGKLTPSHARGGMGDTVGEQGQVYFPSANYDRDCWGPTAA